MFYSFKEGNLADCGRRHTIVLLLESDLLKGDDFACDDVFTFEDDTVRTLAKLIDLLVALELFLVVAKLALSSRLLLLLQVDVLFFHLINLCSIF